MIHRSWFTLVVRAVGLLILALGLPDALGSTYALITALLEDQTGFRRVFDYGVYALLQGVVGYILVALGLYLFFGGRWVIDRCVREFEGRCPRCGYGVAGQTSPTCPECGVALPDWIRKPARGPAAPEAGR